MSLATWIAFAFASTVLLLIPGPTVLLVVSYALTQGKKVAVAVAAGVALGDFTAMTLSLAGLGALLLASATLFTALKWIGAAYLVWLGVASLRAASRARDDAPAQRSALAAGVAVAQTAPPDRAFATAFRAAVLLQLGNPKAILFFTALLPQFVSPESTLPVAAQIAILGATGNVAEFFVLSGYGLLAARAARVSDDPRLLAAFERASGVCLIGCAALALAA
ncbi:MAG TPA: LysE family translocator [Candidatus Saccharimonadia bacterium]|nr:LysE family translocator [Candidatus Saccharimonadia bacterium]